MKTVTDTHTATDEGTAATADLAAEVTGISPRMPATPGEAYRALAAWFTVHGWAPAEMRAAEHVFFPASPVADAMEHLPALYLTCETAIRHVPCGLDGCGAGTGLACDGGTGVHVVRLGSAMKRRVITGGQFVEALQSVAVFTGSTIVRPGGAR